jgi:seryl-tRNA synthetase
LIYDTELNRKKFQLEIETKRHEFNDLNRKRENIEKCQVLKTEIKTLEDNIALLNEIIFTNLLKIPNVPHITVKEGKGYDDNEVIFQKDFQHTHENLKHWEIAEKLNIINFELGNKITGKGFPVYINKGARLQRAIINFCLDEANKFGFIEHQVPILVNKDTVYATGQFPDKEDQMYYLPKDDLYLIPTAEVPLTNIYRDTIVNKEELPIMLTGYTPCFRREAGGYGKDIKGLNRLHQFDKIELVCITTQEDGYNRLEIMKEYIQTLLDKLQLTYRVLELCGAEMGFGAAKAYDIETWCPNQEKWLEVVTVTNFETFQANRLKCRYKEDKKNKLVHTLNGTGLALPRIVATILETYQRDNGIDIPEILKPYTGFDRIC